MEISSDILFSDAFLFEAFVSRKTSHQWLNNGKSAMDPTLDQVSTALKECNTVNPTSYCDISETDAGGGPVVAAQPATPCARKKEVQDYSQFDIVKAVQYGAIERVKEIVEAGFDVNQRDEENITLLHWASINNRKEIVHYLLKKVGYSL